MAPPIFLSALPLWLQPVADYFGLALLTLSLMTAVVPPWRTKVVNLLRRSFTAWQRFWNADLFRRQEHIIQILEKGAPKWDEALAISTQNSADIAALRSVVQNGLSHSMARLMVRHKQDFEADPTPKFACDEAGSNWLVSSGYLIIVGTGFEDLRGLQWHSVIHGPLSADYLRRFNEAAAAKSDFTAVCDFQNPRTGDHRGRWRVYADCDALNDAVVYTGRFIRAEDEKAAEIARAAGWSHVYVSEKKIMVENQS